MGRNLFMKGELFMRKKLIALLLSVSVASMVLAGCGGSDDSSKKDTSSKVTSEKTSEKSESEEETSEETTEETTEGDDQSFAGFKLTDLAGYMTDCYAGITDEEDTYMYYATNEAADFGILVVYNTTEQQYFSFVGASTINGDGTMTIVDDQEGYQFTFGVTDNGDGSYLLDCGPQGEALVDPCDSGVLLDAMQTINDNAEMLSLDQIGE